MSCVPLCQLPVLKSMTVLFYFFLKLLIRIGVNKVSVRDLSLDDGGKFYSQIKSHETNCFQESFLEYRKQKIPW